MKPVVDEVDSKPDNMYTVKFSNTRVVGMTLEEPANVKSVTAGGQAAQKGVKSGDKIIGINGEDAQSYDVVMEKLKGRGEVIEITFLRGGGGGGGKVEKKRKQNWHNNNWMMFPMFCPLWF